MIKGTQVNIQLEGWIRQVRSCHTLAEGAALQHSHVHRPGSFPNPHCWDLVVASSCRHDQLLAPFQLFSLSGKMRGEAENSNLLIYIIFSIMLQGMIREKNCLKRLLRRVKMKLRNTALEGDYLV